MATTGTAFNSVAKAVSGQNYKIHNASCVLGLTRASDVVSEPMSLATSAYKGGIKNGLPYATGTGHDKALSSGSFAYGPVANKWVVLGNNITATLSGVANTVLKSGAAQFFRRAIPWSTTPYITFCSGIAWVATELEGPVFTVTKTATHLSFGTDVAAQLSRTSRSSVFYMVTGKLATETSFQNLSIW